MQARLFSEILSAQKRLLVAGDVSTRHGRWRAAARVAETLAQQVDAEEWSAQITRALERALGRGPARERWGPRRIDLDLLVKEQAGDQHQHARAHRAHGAQAAGGVFRGKDFQQVRLGR